MAHDPIDWRLQPMTSEEGQTWRLVTENYAPYFKAPNGLLVALEAMPVHLNVLEAAARDRESLEARVRELEACVRDLHTTRGGFCTGCGNFVGYDHIQEIQGDEEHEDYCEVVVILARYDALLSQGAAE